MKLSELRKAAREGVEVEAAVEFIFDFKKLDNMFRDYQEDAMEKLKSAFALPPSHFMCRTTVKVKWPLHSGDALKMKKLTLKKLKKSWT